MSVAPSLPVDRFGKLLQAARWVYVRTGTYAGRRAIVVGRRDFANGPFLRLAFVDHWNKRTGVEDLVRADRLEVLPQ